LKILEEAIKASGKKGLYIGINCSATDILNPTTTKYEMEGAKANFDQNQMV
jgi:aryl-phospho-beta-D-glucosidase BglC (GH1 family)